MRRLLMRLVVVAVMAALAAATAVPAFADKGGGPNENACQGQINSTLNTRYGTTPKEAANFLGQHGLSTGNPGDYEKQIRNGGWGTFDPEVGYIFCPLTP